jgi:hypothetical protein
VSTCHWCGPTDRELRPYGPGGANICYPCMKADPGRERAAAGVFGALLDANAAIGDDIVVIGSQDGPQPFDPDSLR